MPEQLSQSQIDALLKKMSSGEVDVQDETNKVKEYDFSSPKKFTREQLKSVDSLHETFSRVLASYLSGLLRTVCDIEVVQIEEQRYYEYNNALPDASLIGLVDVHPVNKRYSDATMLLDMSTTIGYYIIDRVLGGPGTGYNYTRNYTDIEISILSNVLGKITQRIQDTWSNNLEMTTSLNSIETNSRLLQVFAPEDIVVIVIMEVKLGSRLSGNISVCIPAEFLEEVIDTFSLRYVKGMKKHDPKKEEAKKKVILENVLESDMEIKAIFDDLKLDFQDILNLQKDDIIPLGKAIDSNVHITIDGVPWYTAKLGESKQKKAIKLQNIVINGDEGSQWEKEETVR